HTRQPGYDDVSWICEAVNELDPRSPNLGRRVTPLASHPLAQRKNSAVHSRTDTIWPRLMGAVHDSDSRASCTVADSPDDVEQGDALHLDGEIGQHRLTTNDALLELHRAQSRTGRFDHTTEERHFPRVRRLVRCEHLVQGIPPSSSGRAKSRM